MELIPVRFTADANDSDAPMQWATVSQYVDDNGDFEDIFYGKYEDALALYKCLVKHLYDNGQLPKDVAEAVSNGATEHADIHEFFEAPAA